jgi:hypothetical protein
MARLLRDEARVSRVRQVAAFSVQSFTLSGQETQYATGTITLKICHMTYAI